MMCREAATASALQTARFDFGNVWQNRAFLSQ